MATSQPVTLEDEASLFSLASEFLEAADILARTPPIKLKVSLVTTYLLGHAAELLLKSSLHQDGVPIEELKKVYGHNLSKLVQQARKQGLLASISLSNVEELSKTYSPKLTEYRQKVAGTYPQIESLLQELRALQSHVFNQVGRFQSEA